MNWPPQALAEHEERDRTNPIFAELVSRPEGQFASVLADVEMGLGAGCGTMHGPQGKLVVIDTSHLGGPPRGWPSRTGARSDSLPKGSAMRVLHAMAIGAAIPPKMRST